MTTWLNNGDYLAKKKDLSNAEVKRRQQVKWSQHISLWTSAAAAAAQCSFTPPCRNQPTVCTNTQSEWCWKHASVVTYLHSQKSENKNNNNNNNPSSMCPLCSMGAECVSVSCRLQPVSTPPGWEETHTTRGADHTGWRGGLFLNVASTQITLLFCLYWGIYTYNIYKCLLCWHLTWWWTHFTQSYLNFHFKSSR